MMMKKTMMGATMVTVAAMFKNQYIMEQELELRRETEEINAILIEKYKYSGDLPTSNMGSPRIHKPEKISF